MLRVLFIIMIVTLVIAILASVSSQSYIRWYRKNVNGVDVSSANNELEPESEPTPVAYSQYSDKYQEYKDKWFELYSQNKKFKKLDRKPFRRLADEATQDKAEPTIEDIMKLGVSMVFIEKLEEQETKNIES